MKSREGKGPARHTIIAASFLACAVVLGGGGSPNPGTEFLLQLIFVVAAAAWLWTPLSVDVVPFSRPASVWIVCALILALPLLQLIPLPAGIWTSIPGNEDRVAALALVGRQGSWQPLSHAPTQTVASVLAIVPALFAFVASASLGSRGRSWILGVIALMALVSALVGAMQLSLGEQGFNLYDQFHPGVVTGFQANRNATADVLLIGAAATAAFLAPSLAQARQPGTIRGLVFMPGSRAPGLVLASVLVLLILATVLTRSRTGIALAPLALLGIWIILRPALKAQPRWLLLVPVTALGVGLLIMAGLMAGNSVLAGVAGRFSLTHDFRIELWTDAWFAMARAWPFGIGMGGVQSALIAAERLEILDALLPNRVHNDYLELTLEAGVVGLVFLAAIATLLVRLAWRTWRDRPEDRHMTACGLTILAIAAAHSFVDYPLRSMALACLIGTGAGLLVATPRVRVTNDAVTNGSIA
ncbi:MAG: O-antigen ligase family protein [Croceibacterium sp.]